MNTSTNQIESELQVIRDELAKFSEKLEFHNPRLQRNVILLKDGCKMDIWSWQELLRELQEVEELCSWLRQMMSLYQRHLSIPSTSRKPMSTECTCGKGR